VSRHTAGIEDGELVVQVSDINHLFTAPPTDLMAQNEAAVMGEPALLRVVRKLMSARTMQAVHKLTILLPPDQITPGLEERTRLAVGRYCRLKIEDNDAQLRVMRHEAGRLLLRGILILLLCMAVSSLFNSETFTALPPLLNSTLGEGFNVIGWVMLWRPVEAYFFNPLPVRTSSAAHQFLQTLHVDIRPSTAALRGEIRPPPAPPAGAAGSAAQLDWSAHRDPV
jgi:hypothetical protein